MHFEMEHDYGSGEDASSSDDPVQSRSENEHSSHSTESGEQQTIQNESQPEETQAEIDPMSIPDSVRGAPEALKSAIRKKQNKESARRSRRKKKELIMNLGESIDMLIQKTQEIEARLGSMEQFLSKSGYEAPPRLRLGYPGLTLTHEASLPTSDGGPSHSGSIVMGGSDGGSQSRSGAPSNAAQQRTSGRRATRYLGIDDEEVEILIARCLDQL